MLLKEKVIHCKDSTARIARKHLQEPPANIDAASLRKFRFWMDTVKQAMIAILIICHVLSFLNSERRGRLQ